MWKKRLVEEDEGEAGPPKRRRGASTSLLVDDDDDDGDDVAEQEDEDSADDLDSADEYDEDLFKGPADRAELLAKTDLEREMILADRHERKQRRMEMLQVRAEMRAQRAASKQQTQRRGGARAASSAHADKSAKLAELAAKRQQSERRQKEKQKVEERAPSEDGSEEGEMMADAASRAAAEKRERAERARREREEHERQPKEGPAPFDQLERIRLTRQKLEKWINEPFFETVVVGCFARVGIGIQDGQPTYRVAEITGVKDGFRPYPIEKVTTTKRIELQIGTSRRYFQMNYVSNADFVMPELEKYGRLMKAANLQTKTLTFINEKVAELLSAKTHTYSEAEVAQKVKLERAAQKMKGNLALRKIQLTNEIDGLKQRLAIKATGDASEEEERKRKEDEDELQKLEEEFKGLDKKEDLQKKIDDKREGGSFRITDINERNRKFQREVEDKVGARDLQDQVEISAGRVTASDPFKRLPIRPVIYWDVKLKTEGDEDTEAAAPAAAPEPALTVETASGEVAQEDNTKSPGLAHLLETPHADETVAAADDEPEGGALDESGMPRLSGKRAQAHDIDIDIDIVDTEPAAPRARPSMVVPKPRPVAAGAAPTGGQRLSLRDYKSRIEEA